MSRADGVSQDTLDALAVLTASYENDTTFGTLISDMANEAEEDTELAVKLLGLVSGMASVGKLLIEYCADVAGDDDQAHDVLTDVVLATSTTTAPKVTELLTTARRLVDYCCQVTGVDHQGVLTSLGIDLHTGPDE
ncbi:hypothetical protein [Mycolicibacterium palauense]|uniref:hypothetical protein n=1 Tax=Mycolicibacterium palauense TaxID=2034511 RepID=UPI000BFEE5C6|nr:hypothetical protein [Mycolicibacterium palauense]